MDSFENSVNNSSDCIQNPLCNQNLSQQVLQNNQQYSSQYSLSQKNEAFNSSQNKPLSQQFLPHIDNTLKLEDLNGKSSAKHNQCKNIQQEQLFQQQQSMQTLKSFNSSNILYQQSTLTTHTNVLNHNQNLDQQNMDSNQSCNNMHQNHLSNSSQDIPYSESHKNSQQSIHQIHKLQQQIQADTIASNQQNIYSQKSLIYDFEGQKQFQEGQQEELDDQVRFFSTQQDEDNTNTLKISNSNQFKQDSETQYSYDKIRECQQISSSKISQKNEGQANNNTRNLAINQPLINNNNPQNNRKGSLCASNFSGNMGLANNDENIQVKIVNEILNFDDQKFNFTVFSNLNATGQQQFMNTNNVEIGSRIENSTIKNLFNSTKDFQDISALMANIEYTEQNMKLIDELNQLNKAIKDTEQKIEQISTQQNNLNGFQNEAIYFNSLTVKDRLKNIDEYRNKNLEPTHLKEMLNGRQQHLKSLNKDLIKLESERERQKQLEGDIIKKVDKDFQKDIDLMNQGLKEISNLKSEVLREMQSEEELGHNLQERKSLGKEELIAKLMQRAEMVAQMEDFEEIQEDFKQKFPLEAKYLFQQLQLKKDLETMQKKHQDYVSSKKEKMSLLEQIQQQIKELNEFAQYKYSAIQEVLNYKQQQLRIYNDKMETIEEQINKKCSNFGFESGQNVFLQIFDERFMVLSKQALEKQIQLIESEETQLNDQYLEQIEALEQGVQISQYSPSESSTSSISLKSSPQSSPLRSLKSNFSQSLKNHNQVTGSPSNNCNSISKQTLSANQYPQDDISQCKSEHQKVKEIFLIRSTMLRKWKEKAKEYLSSLEIQINTLQFQNNGHQIDRQHIKNLIQFYLDSTKISYEQTEIDFLADLYEQYFEAFSQQKLIVIDNRNEESENCLQIEEVEKKVKELKEANEQVQLEILTNDEDVQKIINIIKQKEQEINSKRIIMENILLQQADQAFQDYIEQQSEVFEGLQKTYGSKALQQIKLGHHKQFREIMKQNQEKRMQKFEEVQAQITKLNQQIQDNIKYVDTNLSEDLGAIQAQIDDSFQKKSQLQVDYQTILEKEKEFERQLESLLQAKKVKVIEILQDNSNYISQSTYEKRKIKLQKEIEDCESEIKIIEQNLKNLLTQDIYSLPLKEQINKLNIQTFEDSYDRNKENQNPNEGERQFLVHQSVNANVLKKDLEELQMQRLALESRLIEINFNINTANNSDFKSCNLVIPYENTNKLQSQVDQKMKEDTKTLKNSCTNTDHEQPNTQNKFKKELISHEQPAFFNGSGSEINSRKQQKLVQNNNILFNQIDENSSFLIRSQLGGNQMFNTADQMIDQKQFENKNIKAIENLSQYHFGMENDLDQISGNKKISSYKNEKQKFNSSLSQHSEHTYKIENVNQNVQISSNEQFKQNQHELKQDLTSDLRGIKQDEFECNDYRLNSNLNNQSDLCKIKQQLFGTRNHQLENQGEYFSSLNEPHYGLIQNHKIQFVEHEDDPIIIANTTSKNLQKQRNILNQYHQIAIQNNNNNQCQQNIFQSQPMQSDNIIQQNPMESNRDFSSHFTNEAVFKNIEDTQSLKNGLKNKDIIQNQFNQQQYQQYEDLGQTLQTITEEQISTNRGQSARNYMQQYLNIHQITQNDQLNYQPNFIKDQQEREQALKYESFQNSKTKQPKLNLGQYHSYSNQITPKNINLSQQQVKAEQTNNYQENSQSLRERKKNQQIESLTINQKIANQNINYYNGTHIQQTQNNSRAKSLMCDAKESSKLLHENFKVKTNLKQNPKNQFSKTQNNYQIQEMSKNKQQRVDASLKQLNLDQNTYNNVCLQGFLASTINQQENLCPNIIQPLTQQFINLGMSKQQQKNIQPLLSHTSNSLCLQQNNYTINEAGNWFQTPNQNIQISFNSYLNSSLNKQKNLSKQPKQGAVDIQKCSNNYSLDVRCIQPQSSKHQNSQAYPVQNQYFENNYNQHQNLSFDPKLIYQSQDCQLQQFSNQDNTSFSSLQQQQIDQQLINFDQDIQKYQFMAQNKKKRRSKSEEMKGPSAQIQPQIKSNTINIKGPLLCNYQNNQRSKSQSVQGQGESLLNKNIQSLSSVNCQQIQNYQKQFIYKLHLEQLQNKEAQFLIQIKDLLEGTVIMKKFSQYQSLKQHVFNPFTCDQMPPENCGFGQRLINLHKNLTKIEIRHPLKQGTVESTINIDQILRYTIPNTTLELLKIQKELRQQKECFEQGLQQNKINIQNLPALENIDQISYYAFCIVLDKGGRIEFIAQDYKTFNMWIQGLQQIIKQKKLLPRLKNYIEQVQII
ncbi:hypothetical protein TTHERM_00420270 (macronuclear) [Tetrahymena thermophila SB210]|uniref:Uncharacterized protein n=1 Tax=Tetrahymena thermophila (strain SB210) TaxID=312017 RepID=I7M075_TETTS|nr:hypothetical protein TTHERM_00420270 [Tetrahymena thermophila SB210]EAR85619.2 hypothetical protein TTHERM_00420270 [Tetrahymena thermophila SB210]|eukprot:XP_001033282.2 hypothetical protein TTHERM_00420270 [Tetrahymena thermophila SB210]